MSAVNLNDTPLHLHEWAELDHIAALECLARQRQAAKLTEADLDAADARRAAGQVWERARAKYNADVTARAEAWRRGGRKAYLVATLYRRLKRTLRIVWLHWTISSNEQWIEAARRGGILTSENLRMVRAELEALRVELAVERGQP